MSGNVIDTVSGCGAGAFAAGGQTSLAGLAGPDGLAGLAGQATMPFVLADRGIAREDRLRLGRRFYELTGKPEHLPMSVFRPARQLSLRAAALVRQAGFTEGSVREGVEPDEAAKELLMAFYTENMDSIVDVTYGLLRFALGEEQFEEALDAIDDLGFFEFCQVGVDIMARYRNIAAR